MADESQDFSIDPFRADLIEDIAKNNETIFRNFKDFVSDAIGTYINWWKFPEKSQQEFLALIPHMKKDMVDNLETIMPKKHFEELTKNYAEDRKKLKKIEYNQSPPGKKTYSLDPIRLGIIEEIINTENVSKKINSVETFCDNAIALYVTWWTKPVNAQPLMYAIWPYMPTKTKSDWKNNPNEMWRETYMAFDRAANEYLKGKNKKSTNFKDSSLTNVEDSDYEKTDDEINQKTKQQESFQIEQHNVEYTTEKPTMQSASKNGTFHFNRLCKQMNEFNEDESFNSLPEHRSNFSLPYDNYPLIWDFYSRLLPTKILVSVLGNMMSEKRSDTVDYKDFREKAYYAALGLAERLSDYEKKWKVKRNAKSSTGFPISPIDTLGKLDLDKMAKFEASKQRFQEHFIGMKKEAWVKRQPNEKDEDVIIQKKSEKMNKGLAYFDGALNAMGLVVVYAFNHNDAPIWKKQEGKWEYNSPSQNGWSLEIGLTQRGYEFYKLENPIFKNYEEQWWDEVLSKKESDFIRKKIIPDFPLEEEFVKKAIELVSEAEKSTPNYISGKVMDEKFDTLTKEWLQKNKNHQSYKLISKSRDDPKIISSWRARTMGRLTEMGIIKWDFEKKTGAAKYTIKK